VLRRPPALASPEALQDMRQLRRRLTFAIRQAVCTRRNAGFRTNLSGRQLVGFVQDTAHRPGKDISVMRLRIGFGGVARSDQLVKDR